ncbi:diguanylate cyclase (GGDEF) domain-containing protein [Devosia limi DSM 17137]|uniref:diguanylate cyclase n=1 Tax=Devosia limi DSM 17137 TaxID=1121477 RepID=A0A1M4VUF1_9HYPH|nr:diguanylate cyclase (GGDEF) domain-containing protein [Devosia limi DSM 17137]
MVGRRGSRLAELVHAEALATSWRRARDWLRDHLVPARIADQRRLENQLRDSQKRLARALAYMADGLAMFDAEGRLIFCNEQYLSFFPRTAHLRVPGAAFRDILEAVVASGEQLGAGTGANAACWVDEIAASLHVMGEEEVHLFDGHWLHIRTRPTDDGTSMVVVSDMTKIKRDEAELLILTEQLKVLASTDGLTGLMNRRAFDHALDTELARSRRNNSPLSLLIIDIDWFKAFNDLYGHPAGDTCLRAVGASLKRVLTRPADFVARYGGEEFVAVLPDMDEAGAIKVAEAFRRALLERNLVHGGSGTGRVTASVGAATYRAHSDLRWSRELVSRADQALYNAKAEGRDRICAWSANYTAPETRTGQY